MHACRDVLCAVNTWTCHYIYPRYDELAVPQPEVAAGHAATIQRLYGTARLGNADYPSSRDVPYMVLGAMENQRLCMEPAPTGKDVPLPAYGRSQDHGLTELVLIFLVPLAFWGTLILVYQVIQLPQFPHTPTP